LVYIKPSPLPILPIGYTYDVILLPAGSPITITYQRFGFFIGMEDYNLPVTICLLPTTPLFVGVGEHASIGLSYITFCYLNSNSSGAPAACSFDPNVKLVYPKGCTDKGLISPDDSLTYYVMFQNTGSAPALRVIITDTLSSNLDTATFEPLFATHFYSYQFINDTVVEIWFNPIYLPDSATNLDSSMGWIAYNIKPKPNLPAGTQIKNRAAIYFDYHDPIITPEIINTIADEPMKEVTILNKNQTTCESQDVIFTASDAIGYLWSNGATTQSISVNTPGQYIVTAYYDYSCPSTDTATLSVIPSPSVNITATPVNVCNQYATIYLGYGNQTQTLTATVTGGISPYQYSWSSGSTSANITVSPTTTTVYKITVTSANNCTATNEIVVTVIDIRCGKNKVIICHSPNGNPLNAHSLCININAVPAHLNNHPFDCLGPCNNNKKATSTPMDEDPIIMGDVIVNYYPNPIKDNAIFTLSSFNDTKIKFGIYDINGKKVLDIYNGIITQSNVYEKEIDFSSLKSGIYFYKIETDYDIYFDKLVIIK